MAVRGNLARAAIRAKLREEAANLPLLAHDISFPERVKARLRAQIELLLTRVDEEAAKPHCDSQKIDRLASALDRMIDAERIADGRPGPGTLKPTPERKPASDSRGAAIPRPPDVPAQPNQAKPIAPLPAGGPAQQPGLTERPDFE
jgi:hypothetical protein